MPLPPMPLPSAEATGRGMVGQGMQLKGGNGELDCASLVGKKTVLFVCTGNVCRSPMAEGLFRQATQARPYRVFSAGLGAVAGQSARTHRWQVTAQGRRLITALRAARAASPDELISLAA